MSCSRSNENSAENGPILGAARTLDLDLILLGDAVIDEPGLQVPHPRFRARFFVLGPLAEIAPDLRRSRDRIEGGELLQTLLQDNGSIKERPGS